MDLKEKGLLWGLGALVLIASTFATAMIQRVITTTDAKTVLELKLNKTERSLEQAIRSATEADQRTKAYAQKYERLTALVDAQGRAVLDGAGNPIFNVERGDSSSTEQSTLIKSQYEAKLLSKDSSLDELSKELQELKAKTVKPGLRPITLTLAYEPDQLTLAGLQTGRWWPGLGYNFILGPWTWSLSGLAGISPGHDPGGMLMLQMQP